MAKRTMTTNSRDADTDEDSISATSTVDEDYGSDQEFEVERILAETERGPKQYLILWTGYPEERSTWEPRKHIKDPILLEAWKDQKMRQDRGQVEPFNVEAFNLRVQRLAREKKERQRRRKAKRRRLGVPVSSSDESQLFDSSQSSDEAVKSNYIVEDDVSRRSSKTSKPRTLLNKPNLEPPNTELSDPNAQAPKASANATASKAPIFAEDSESDDRPLVWRTTNKQSKPPTETRNSNGGSILSNSSLDIPLAHEQIQSMTNAPSEQRSQGSNTPATTHPKVPQTVPQAETETQAEPIEHARGRPSGKGASSTRGPGAKRGGSSLGHKNVFAAGEARKKRATLIENAANPARGAKHFKNLHQVRKAQLAGREVADSAPDISAIPGGLFDPTQPMAYKGLKPAILRKASSALKDSEPQADLEAIDNAPLTTGLPPPPDPKAGIETRDGLFPESDRQGEAIATSKNIPWQLQQSDEFLKQVCFFWHTNGRCTKQEGDCSFLHTHEGNYPIRPPPAGYDSHRKKSFVPETFPDLVEPAANYIDDDHFHNGRIHERAVKVDNRKICRFWEGSNCKYTAADCRFKHSYDLRPGQTRGSTIQSPLASRQAQEPAVAGKSESKPARPKSVSFAIDEPMSLVDEPGSYAGSNNTRSGAERVESNQAYPAGPVCSHWLRGCCRHGASCWNRHEQLRASESVARHEISAAQGSTAPTSGFISRTQIIAEHPSPPVRDDAMRDAEVEAQPWSTSAPENLIDDSKTTRNKISMGDYKKKSALKKFGDRGKEVIFGASSSQAVFIDFGEFGQEIRHPWGQAFARISKISFDRMCMGLDLDLQCSKLFKQVLRHDIMIVDPTDGTAVKAIEMVVDQLRLRTAGLISVFPEFVILVYPAQNEEWKFLEANSNLPRQSGLRYLIFESELDISSSSVSVASEIASLQLSDVNNCRKNLVKLVHNLSFSTVLPRKQALSTPHIYLLFPSTAHATGDFLIKWLRACRTDCKIYTPQTEGSWRHFLSTPAVDAAVVLIHESAVSVISRMPSLTKLLYSPRSSNFWFIADSGSLYPTYPSTGSSNVNLGSLSCIRLFPHGHVFLLTPSFLIAEPDHAFQLISWFLTDKLKQAAPGTWKLACCRNLSDYLLDLAIQKADELDAFNAQHANNPAKDAMAANRGLSWQSCDKRFRTHSLLIELFPAAFSDDGLLDVDEIENPFIFAPGYIDSDNEQALATWFAGWAMTRLDLYRKFTVVGTTPTSGNRTSRMKAVPIPGRERESIRPSPPRSPQPRLERGSRIKSGAAPSRPLPSEEILYKNSPMTEQKRKAMAVAARLTAACSTGSRQPGIKATTMPATQPLKQAQVVDTMTTTSPSVPKTASKVAIPRHGITEDIPQLELHFIATAGASLDQARTYLTLANNNLDAAVALYSWEQGGTAMDIDPPAPAETTITTTSTYPQEANLAINEPLNRELPSPDRHNSIHFDLPTSRSGSRPILGNELTTRAGIRTNEDGTQYVPSSTRPSGAEQKEKHVRPGYIPDGDVEVYKVRKRRQSGSGRDRSTNKSGSADEVGEFVMKGREKLSKDKSSSAGGEPVGETIMQEIHFEPTTVWYKRLVRDNGEAWEHVLVEGWEVAFKVLQVKGFV